MRLGTTFGAVTLVITDLPICRCPQDAFHRLRKGPARFHITLQIHPIHSGPKFSSSVNEKRLACHDSPMLGVHTFVRVHILMKTYFKWDAHHSESPNCIF